MIAKREWEDKEHALRQKEKGNNYNLKERKKEKKRKEKKRKWMQEGRKKGSDNTNVSDAYGMLQCIGIKKEKKTGWKKKDH